MTTYRMMDESCLLPACLHGGPVPLASLREALTATTDIERQEGLPPGALARFAQALCQRYGSGAVLATAGDLVVGKLRFAPEEVERLLSGICFQQEAEARRLGTLDLTALPAREALARQELRLGCFQVAGGYEGQGIAKGLLDTALGWARATGWKTVRSSAIRHLPPLLNWSGEASAKALQERGFVVVSEETNPHLREVIVSQRQGHHGEEVKRQWEACPDLSDEEAAARYELVLDLRG